MFSLENKVEAILFYKSEPVCFDDLVNILNVSEDELRMAIDILAERLRSNSGIRLIFISGELQLVTATEASELITQFMKDAAEKDLSKSALETLAIVIYRAPISRTEIDYIRGVNSQAILRTLMIRGLVGRSEVDGDSRILRYEPTSELLRNLGLEKIENMPEYAEVRTMIDKSIIYHE